MTFEDKILAAGRDIARNQDCRRPEDLPIVASRGDCQRLMVNARSLVLDLVRQGLTRKALAKQLGVNRSTIWTWEHKGARPRGHAARRLCDLHFDRINELSFDDEKEMRRAMDEPWNGQSAFKEISEPTVQVAILTPEQIQAAAKGALTPGKFETRPLSSLQVPGGSKKQFIVTKEEW